MVSLEDCLIYAGYKNPEGYGRNEAGGVHRQMYEHFIGEVPEGLELDHLCEIKSCINPEHLEAVTHLENAIRGNKKRRISMCKKGLHEMSGENLYVWKPAHYTSANRMCRACQKVSRARRTERDRLKRKLQKLMDGDGS